MINLADVFQLLGTVAIDTSDASSQLLTISQRGTSAQKGLTGSFKKIGAAVATYFTATKIIEFGTELINLASTAQTAAAKVNTLLESGTDTNAYFNDMVSAASASGVAIADFAEATYQAISASVDQKDAVAFVTDAIKLAKGGFTDTTTAVDVLTTALNAYNDETLTASHVSDVLVTTQNLGKTTVAELASYMGKVIPIASAYGVNIENLGAAYAVMTAGGIATAESTTYLKSMMNELADSGKGVGLMLTEKTGMSFAQIMEQGYSLGDVLGLLYNMSGENAEAFAQLWSSTEAGTGALAIVNAGAKKYNQTVDSMANSAGSTQEAYDTMTDTFDAKITKLKTTLSNAGADIGEKFLPVLEDIVEMITESIAPALASLQDFMNKFFTEEGVDWSVLGETIGTAFTQVMTNLPSILQTAWDEVLFPFIQGLVKTVLGIELPSIADVQESIKTWWANVVKDIVLGISAVFFGVENETTVAGYTDQDIVAATQRDGVSFTNIDEARAWYDATYVPHNGKMGYANGLDFVNRDQMPALLHYGEAVLNRTEARAWREGRTKDGTKPESVNNSLNVGTINLSRDIDVDSFFSQYDDFVTRKQRGYGWG